MREIKFRAWDKKREKMSEPSNLNGFTHGYVIDKEGTLKASYFYLEDCEIMQYTGLEDINGDEIYEGDICLMQLKDTVVEGKIKYCSPCFVLNTTSDSWDLDNYFSIKIIGNIYENPELLKS